MNLLNHRAHSKRAKSTEFFIPVLFAFFLGALLFVFFVSPAMATSLTTEPVETTDLVETEETPDPQIYDKPYIGDMQQYVAKYEDTLIGLAQENNLGFVEMRAANPFVDPWIPGKGTDITMPTRHILPDTPYEGIVINLPEMRLYAFAEPGEEPLSFPIGVGREGLMTPMGATTVIRKKIGPTWRPTERMRKEDPELPEEFGPGPNNPLGTHALYLGWPEYAIHGTNRPYGIGRRVSSGCIRLHPKDIITLFNGIDVGAPVRVVNQPIKMAWINDELYIEAHPGLDQSTRIEQNGGLPQYSLSDEEMSMVMGAVSEEEFALLDWEALWKAVRARNGFPIIIAKRPTIEPEKEQAEKKQEPAIEEVKQSEDRSEQSDVMKAEEKDEQES